MSLTKDFLRSRQSWAGQRSA